MQAIATYLGCCFLVCNVKNVSVKMLVDSYLQIVCQSLKTHQTQWWVYSESYHCLYSNKATQV